MREKREREERGERGEKGERQNVDVGSGFRHFFAFLIINKNKFLPTFLKATTAKNLSCYTVQILWVGRYFFSQL